MIASRTLKIILAATTLCVLPVSSLPAFSFVAGQETPIGKAGDLPSENEKKGYWGDIMYGSADAPVEIVEYASLTCSHCGNFARTIFPKLKEKYIDTGKVRLRFRNFFLNEFDFALTVVARCKDGATASKIVHSFLVNQPQWMGESAGQAKPAVVLEALAAIEGLPIGQFQECVANKALVAHLGKKREQWATVENITHTPTIKLDGIELAPPTWVKLETAIEMKLAALK